MTSIGGDITHRTQPFQSFRGGGALRAIVVLRCRRRCRHVMRMLCCIMQMMMMVIMRVIGMQQTLQRCSAIATIRRKQTERCRRGCHRIARKRGDIVLRPMMRLSQEQIAFLTQSVRKKKHVSLKSK